MALRHIVLNRAITICFKTKHRKDILDKVLDRAKTASPSKHRNRLDALVFIKTSISRARLYMYDNSRENYKCKLFIICPLRIFLFQIKFILNCNHPSRLFHALLKYKLDIYKYAIHKLTKNK